MKQLVETVRQRMQHPKMGKLAASLALGLAAAACIIWWTGAWLTAQDDWQGLAGTYQLGIIDYVVEINDETLIEQDREHNNEKRYNLVVPIKGGVKLFDSAAIGESASEKETHNDLQFNEGATIMRIRLINSSSSLIRASANLRWKTTPRNAAFYYLVLPKGIAYKTLNYRKYALSTVEENQTITTQDAFDAAYESYIAPVVSYDLLPGVTSVEPSGEKKYQMVTENGKTTYRYYDEFYALVWVDFDTMMIPNKEGNKSGLPVGKDETVFSLTITVGQNEISG